MANILEKAVPLDAEAFASIQNAAFRADFVEFGVCPAYGRTPNELVQAMSVNETYRIMLEGEIVGKLSLKREGTHAHIGCLCIAPRHQGQGLGRRALEEIESLAPEILVWELETPAARPENIRFYEGCGFRVTNRFMGDIALATLTKQK